MLLSAVLIPAEEGGYVAFDPQTGTTTQGGNVSEALANLCEAAGLYLEEFMPSAWQKRELEERYQEFLHHPAEGAEWREVRERLQSLFQ